MKKLSGIVTIALLTVLLVSCGLGGGREISLTPRRKWQILFIYLLFRNIEALYFRSGFPGPIKV